MAEEEPFHASAWGTIWNCLEVLTNIEYLARNAGALTVEQKLYLDVMETELIKLKSALREIYRR